MEGQTMRYNNVKILALALGLCLLPLGWTGSTSADQTSAPGFKVLLTDGTVLRGAVAFTLNLDTQYGQLTVPSANFISANFDPTDEWAQIQTNSIELKVQYKPDQSTLVVTTEVGPVTVSLSKVVSVQSLSAEQVNAAPAVNPYEQQAAAYPPAEQSPYYSDIYSQPATDMDLTPYEYGAPAPYYWPSYYPVEPFGYTDEYPFLWPDFGFAVISNFDNHHHEFFHHGFGNHDGFDNVVESHNFHAAWNGSWHSATVGSGVRFNEEAGLNQGAFRSIGSVSPAISAGTFRSITPSFTSEAPAFRSEAAPAFRSGGVRFSSSSFERSGGFAHSAGFAHSGGWGGYAHSGGFSHAGGFGGGRR
jgi:hypothetical protein